MVRVNSLMASQEGVKTPHRIELCEEKQVKPAKNYRKRRIIVTAPLKTENEELNSEPLIKKTDLKSKPLKASNGITNMTNGNSARSRAARAAARSAESHKLTEYFKEELKSPKVEQLPPSPQLEKNIKTEHKLSGNTNHKLTEYFPVRRSVRKTSKCVMAEKMRDLERAIREQREDGLQVASFDGKGRGVIATRPFGRGQFVVEYSGELVGVAEARERERKYALDPSAGCYMYYFRLQDQQYCIDATAETGRLGRLVNHSRNGNLLTKALWVDGPRLVLLAAHDIAPGEELTYDYGDRSKESLRHHPWLAL
ncbi:histone-lysine N-methyltransferase PR-Set7 [Vanessa cardui]|uniref:histone-lysine N-methyltransferase PR-Set7 n=1 Tax=Vanessa cardui TaxID=171605 RepID=UPI001F13D5E1|nr:histone-lysine N-methyltransferase PR-Set7 [Vanessa cardui]XP_046963810.1 histone-lysine N-methyltransferase PR-Set7 [Vanessa cardui]